MRGGYRILLWLALPVVVPFFLWRFVRGKEAWSSLGQRLGLSSTTRPKGRCIWMHGVSVGESLAFEGLMFRILAEGSTSFVLLTTSTRSSAELWRRKIAKDFALRGRVVHQVLPFDFSIFFRIFLRFWTPSLCLLSEGGVWPEMLWSCAHKKIPCVVLSARLSEKSLRRWRRVQFFWQETVQAVNFLTSSQAQAKRFRNLGTPRVCALEALKWTRPLPDSKGEKSLWLAAVSTHEGEEKVLLKAFTQIKAKIPHAQFVIAPRHTHRVARVRSLIKQQDLTVADWSFRETEQADVFLVSRMGILGQVFTKCAWVFVGGSLIRDIGGHELVTPAAYGCAVMHGPFMENQDAIRQQFFDADASIEVTEDTLTSTWEKLFQNPLWSVEKAKKARLLVETKQKIAFDLYQKALQPYDLFKRASIEKVS